MDVFGDAAGLGGVGGVGVKAREPAVDAMLRRRPARPTRHVRNDDSVVVVVVGPGWWE